FSPDETDERIFTFAGQWRAGSLAQRQPRRDAPSWFDDTSAPPAESLESVDLATLIRFFDDPPKAFYEGRLGLRLDRGGSRIDDEEPLALDNLQQAAFRRRLFERATANVYAPVDTTPDVLELARGTLPPPPRAGAAFAPEAGIINALLPAAAAWQQD